LSLSFVALLIVIHACNFVCHHSATYHILSFITVVSIFRVAMVTQLGIALNTLQYNTHPSHASVNYLIIFHAACHGSKLPQHLVTCHII